MAPLDADTLAREVERLEGWAVQDNALVKVYAFDGFMPGVRFVDALAEEAEAQGHHPDLEVTYGKVTVRFSTHSEGGITEKDVSMAKAADAL